MSNKNESPTLEDRIRGGVIGAAVGDAVGGPYECMHYKQIREAFGDAWRFEDFTEAMFSQAHFSRSMVHLAKVTDDTCLADLLLDCIIANDGLVNAHTFAAQYPRFDAPLPCGDKTFIRLDAMHFIDRIPFLRNQLRDIPKRELGHGESNATNAIMYIAPVGLLCAGDPLCAELMAADVTAVNQHGRPRDAAGAYAAALAACFIPGMTVENVVETALAHLGDAKTLLEVQAMLDLSGRCRTDEEFIERYYTEILGPVLPYQDWQHLGKPLCNSWNSSEVLGPALVFFLRHRGADTLEMVMSCARLGRDADTIARVGAGLIGAWAGLSSFPVEWVKPVLERNPWMQAEEKSAKLAAIVRRRLERQADWYAKIAAGPNA